MYIGDKMTKEQIYIRLYRVISDQYDIRNSLLSVVIRDCVDNKGTMPSSLSSSEVERQCPGVLDMICKNYFLIIAEDKESL